MAQYADIVNSIPYQSFIIIVIGFSILTAVLYLLSPMIMHRVLEYISTENLNFDKRKFVGNSRLAISFTSVVSGSWLISQDLDLRFSVDDIIIAFLTTILVLIWLRVIHNIGRYGTQKVVESRYDESMIPIIENTWTLLIMTVAIFGVFNIWNIDLTPILASAGVAGVVLGLAARETISNFFGSIALYADDAYESGSFIELNNGEIRGYVRDISIRSTQLVTLKGNKIIVPNSKLHNSIIKNKSAPKPDHRTELDIGVSYDTTPDKAEGVIRRGIEKVVEKEDQYDKAWFFNESEDSYKIFLNKFGDSAIVFKIFIKIKAPQQELPLKSKFYHSIYEELKKEDIGLPYPQRSIHFADENENGEGLSDEYTEGLSGTDTEVPNEDQFEENIDGEDDSEEDR